MCNVIRSSKDTKQRSLGIMTWLVTKDTHPKALYSTWIRNLLQLQGTETFHYCHCCIKSLAPPSAQTSAPEALLTSLEEQRWRKECFTIFPRTRSRQNQPFFTTECHGNTRLQKYPRYCGKIVSKLFSLISLILV